MSQKKINYKSGYGIKNYGLDKDRIIEINDDSFIDDQSVNPSQNNTHKKKTKIKDQSNPQSQPQPRSESHSRSESKSQPRSESRPKSRPHSEPRSKSQPRSESRSDSDSQSQHRSQSRSQTRSQSQDRSDSRSDSRTQSRAQPRSDSRTQHRPDSRTQSQPQNQLRSQLHLHDQGQERDQNEEDKLAKAQETVDKIKNVTMQNISKIIDRGITLEIIDEKAKTLETSSRQYYNKSKGLRRKLYLKKLKFVACIIFFIILVGAAIGLIVHYSSYTIRG